MSLFERYLTVWVFLCIVAGIALGQFLPVPFQVLGRMEVAPVMLLVVRVVNASKGWYEAGRFPAPSRGD